MPVLLSTIQLSRCQPLRPALGGFFGADGHPNTAPVGGQPTGAVVRESVKVPRRKEDISAVRTKASTLSGCPTRPGYLIFIQTTVVPTGRLCSWEKEEDLGCLGRGPQSTGDGLFSTEACAPSIVGAAAFHFRVRDGNGWCHRALATGVPIIPISDRAASNTKQPQ